STSQPILRRNAAVKSPEIEPPMITARRLRCFAAKTDDMDSEGCPCSLKGRNLEATPKRPTSTSGAYCLPAPAARNYTPFTHLQRIGGSSPSLIQRAQEPHTPSRARASAAHRSSFRESAPALSSNQCPSV